MTFGPSAALHSRPHPPWYGPQHPPPPPGRIVPYTMPCSPSLPKVLFKRKPVQFLQPPPVEDDHEVRIPPHPLSTRRFAPIRARGSLPTSCDRYGTYPRLARFLLRMRTISTGMPLPANLNCALCANCRPRLDFYKQVSLATNRASPTTPPLTTPTETLYMSNHRSLGSQLLRGPRVRSKPPRPLPRVPTR
jgi:hypothetical protein